MSKPELTVKSVEDQVCSLRGWIGLSHATLLCLHTETLKHACVSACSITDTPSKQSTEKTESRYTGFMFWYNQIVRHN